MVKTKTKKLSKQREEYKNLFSKRPKNFSIGADVKPKKFQDLHRYVRWPKVFRIQKQKRILMKRLKSPPMINQFNFCADRLLAAKVLKFLNKYRPEAPVEKAERLKKAAAEKITKGETTETKKKIQITRGLDNVVKAIEQKKAQLVVIAHDVDPIELVVFIPTLCKKLNVPYCIIKSQNRLGQLTYSKRNTCVCLTGIKKDDREEFNQLLESVRGGFNDRYYDNTKKWGGGMLSKRTLNKIKKRQTAE